MKRRPTSKIWLTVVYLHRVRGITTFTAMDIHNAMPDARAYYHSLIPAHVIAERDRLLTDNHVIPSRWDHTYTYQVHGMPQRVCDLVALNKNLRDLLRGYPVIDDPYYSTNLTFAEVSNTFKHGYLMRECHNRLFVYHANPAYLEG